MFDYEKWLHDNPNRTNLFALFPWHTVLSIYNRLFFCTPKIEQAEWTLAQTTVLESEMYKAHLHQPWYTGDVLSLLRQEFEQARRIAILTISMTGGTFANIRSKVEQSLSSIDQQYDFPYRMSEQYYVQHDRQNVYQHTLKLYSVKPEFQPSTLLKHCILTPNFGVMRDVLPVHQNLSHQLVQKYSELTESIGTPPSHFQPKEIHRPNLDLSSLKQTLENAKLEVASIESSRSNLSKLLIDLIPDNERSLYDAKIRTFCNSFLVDVELLVMSTDDDTQDFLKLLANSLMNPLTPLANNLWRFDTRSNVRLSDLIDNMLFNARLLGQLTPARLSDVGRTDDMDWYSNLISLFTLQAQSSLATFYSKVLANLDAKFKNQKGTPSPIPFPDLEPKRN